MSDVYKALSDPKRREILKLLRKDDMRAGEIAEYFNFAKPTLSGHFNILKQTNLVVTERVRTTITYSLNVSVFEETIGSILDFFRVGDPDTSRSFNLSGSHGEISK
ncbi:MAG: autorepressor SdpR family transcription factor [Candidatus Electryonea clarkiae]|nr:autorepressor SdpR family transcription factor [Candidatus Electryonea clarkiae]MDP8288208.1 autorepressor SdpR family transcription factor [Candidatus Electryonea clarkiae]